MDNFPLSGADDVSYSNHILQVLRLITYRLFIFLKDPKVYVETILAVHRKYNALVMTAFGNDSGFIEALDKVLFSLFLSLPSSS